VISLTLIVRRRKRNVQTLRKKKTNVVPKKEDVEVQAPAFDHFFRDQQNRITIVTSQKYPMDTKTENNDGSISWPVFYLFCYQRE